MKTMKFPIDLSMLTEEEIDQFRQDPSTLFEGDTDVSLYLRFSSERQREQSIEGQLRDCRTFCKLNSYRITAIYVDRATTARKDVEKRVHFQEMIRDSEKKPWEYVVVWKLDRFARNRTDSALFKFRLRKNGVKVISATENISEKPEGIILEAVLEGMAEFYSADLSQKITRGMRESALKCHSIGGHVPLGYKIEDHKLVINPATAHIVREAFELYANGETVADICRMFNTKGYRTAKGVEFNRNSFKSMFRNKRYIGVYTYKDIEMEGGVPAIIDKELFETVSRRLSKNAEAPARGKAKVDYLLAGKLFCGHCGGSMNGESGTSKTGAVHNYYTCYTRKRKHACEKKPLKKEWIEYIVAQDAMELLTDDTIQELADMAISQTEQDLRENTRIPELTERMKETESGIANITNAIEKGIASDALMNRLVELEKEKKNLLRLLAEEEKYVCKIERSQIVYWLTEFKGGRIEDERYRRIIIDLMVNSVTVWDEPDGFRITTAYNLTSCQSKTFRIDPSSEKGFGFEGSKSTSSSPSRPSFASAHRQTPFRPDRRASVSIRVSGSSSTTRTRISSATPTPPGPAPGRPGTPDAACERPYPAAPERAGAGGRAGAPARAPPSARRGRAHPALCGTPRPAPQKSPWTYTFSPVQYHLHIGRRCPGARPAPPCSSAPASGCGTPARPRPFAAPAFSPCPPLCLTLCPKL